jgi:hypothetical protein
MIAISRDQAGEFSSPYMRKNIRRFGKYGLDMEEMPAPLFPQPLPFKIPL